MPLGNELYIGTLAGGTAGMVKVSSLGQGDYATAIQEGAFTVDPAHYSQTIVMASGDELEAGWIEGVWHISGLRAEQYDALIAYKTAHSNQLYVRSLDNDGATYKNYLVKAIWPVMPNRGDRTAVEEGPVIDFEIKFIQAIEQAEI